MSYLLNWITGRGGDNLLRQFSLREIEVCHSYFRHKHKDQLNFPSADSNALIAYDQKLRNLHQTHGIMQTIQVGLGCYAIRHFFGGHIDRRLFSYLGERKGWYAQIVMYIGIYIYGVSYLRKQKYIDLNHVVNIREKPGETMLAIIMHSFPHKVN